MIVNDRIKELRYHYGLTQEEFGAKIGLSNAFVCRLETTDRGLSIGNIITICNAFNISADWLLGLTNNSGWESEGWYAPYRKYISRKRKKH